MSLNPSLLIGKRIEYKYEHHPKIMKAIVLDKIDTTDKGNYNSDRMEYGQALKVTKYLVQRVDAENPLTNGSTTLITPDMVKRVLD